MAQNEAPYKKLDVDSYKAMREAGTPHLLLDVREPHEFRQAHIPGAKLIPMGTVMSRLNDLRDHENVVLVCRSGSRSAMVATALRDSGMTNSLYNLEGGTMKWAEKGNPVEQGE